MKLFLSLLILGACIYLYIHALNGVIELRLAIPQMEKEIHELTAENERMRYEIDRFKNPLHLMELARKPEFSHLKPDFEDAKP